MSSFLYYCKNCNILDKYDRNDDKKFCTQCGNALFPMGITEQEWYTMDDSAKRDVLKRAVTQKPQEPQKMVVPKELVPDWDDDFDYDIDENIDEDKTSVNKQKTTQQQDFVFRENNNQRNRQSNSRTKSNTANRNVNNNKKAKNLDGKVSGLSIGAFVCSLTIFLSFIGLILGIIDVTKKDNRKKGLSIAAIVIASVFFVIEFAVGGLGSSSSNTAEEKKENIAVTTEVAEETSSEPVEVESHIEDTDTNEDASVNNLDISAELPPEYVYIAPGDLQTYCANLVGQKIYTVAEVADIKEEKVQINLADGYMMSDFVTGTNYEGILNRDDIVAVYGEVEGYNSYSFMGTSAKIKDCVVFATGENAKTYEKDGSDESLTEYFVVTEEVAKSTNENVSEEDYKALCEKLNYNEIMRNPDSFNGKYCVVSGKVSQVIEGFLGGYTIFVKDANGDLWGCTYRYADGESHILEDDNVTFYGECGGTQNTTTVLGKQVSMPVVSVKYIK